MQRLCEYRNGRVVADDAGFCRGYFLDTNLLQSFVEFNLIATHALDDLFYFLFEVILELFAVFPLVALFIFFCLGKIEITHLIYYSNYF